MYQSNGERSGLRHYAVQRYLKRVPFGANVERSISVEFLTGSTARSGPNNMNQDQLHLQIGTVKDTSFEHTKGTGLRHLRHLHRPNTQSLRSSTVLSVT